MTMKPMTLKQKIRILVYCQQLILDTAREDYMQWFNNVGALIDQLREEDRKDPE